MVTENRSVFYNESESKSGSEPGSGYESGSESSLRFITYPYDGDVGAGRVLYSLDLCIGLDLVPWKGTMGPVILYPGFSGGTCVKIKM